MTLSFGWAFAILLAIWFIGSILGKKTGGIVGTSLFSTVVLLIGFWTNILPTDIISTAELQTFNKLVSLVLAINIVSTVEPKQLKKDWRLAVAVLAGIAGMLLGDFIVGKILGYSLGMVIAFCFGCYAGYPLNYGAAMDAVYAQSKTPEEQAMLEEEMVNRVVLGGVVGVTIASVFIGNVCAALL